MAGYQSMAQMHGLGVIVVNGRVDLVQRPALRNPERVWHGLSGVAHWRGQDAMFDRFSQYLTYGATDQKSVRELTGAYDGLIVPGTVAAFQREGTGGFVLSLSATPDSPPYVIDPRFPLFQQSLEDPKKSHEALAELLGAPNLVRADEPVPSDFTDELIQRIAQKWVEFNTSYESRQAAKFKKYADRLDEAVDEDQAKGPSAIIAPYLVSQNEDWWDVSKQLMAATAPLPVG